MSRIDDFMSQVLDLTETEKEELIRFLAGVFCHDFKITSDRPSKNVMLILIPFMSNVMIENLKKSGGEKIGAGRESKKD